MFLESQTLYDFVRKNPPIKIYESYKAIDHYQINTLTKQYMSCIGVENVRGGIYSDETLPEFLLKSLEVELNSTFNSYNDKTNIFDIFSNKQNLTIEDYQKRINEYNSLLSKGYKTITRDFFSLLEWLQNKIESYEYIPNKNTKCIPLYNSEENEKYKKLLQYMDKIIKCYYELDEEQIKVERSAILQHPKFTMDFFIYHTYWNRDWNVEKSVALDILRKYEFMGYTLINIIDGLEFDFYSSEN